MKRIFTIFLTLFVASSAWAYDFEVDGVYYNSWYNAESGYTAMVTYKDKNTSSYSGKIKIPSELWYNQRYYRVTRIDKNAFEDCTSLTSITIPNSVTFINDKAFKGCTGIKSITIPESVKYIADNAFGGCTSLTSITISESVTSIGSGAFEGCTSLTSISIPEGVTSIKKNTFKGCTKLASVTIPESVTSIGEYAFEGCTSLTTIPLSESVTSIGESAFGGCTSLTSITIPESVTSIGESAFEGCTSLTSITIPESVTSIGERAFYGCRGITSINIPKTLDISSANLGFLKDGFYYELWNWTMVEVYGSSGLMGDIEIPSGVSLGDYTFEVVAIGREAFLGNTDLTSIMIPESILMIGMIAFGGCKNLTSVICMATTPPICSYGLDFNKKSVLLYVPCESIDLYRNHTYWGRINSIECISCNISLSASDNAQGSVEGDGEFLLGETVTITAKPASGYKFEQWSDGSTENPRTITVNSDVNYTAIFVEIPVYSVELGVNHASYGSVKGGGEFEEGATASISATAYSGYRFTQWNDGNTANPRKLTVNTDMSFTAMFEEIPVYTVSVTANDASYGSVKGGGEYKEGSTASISATAYPGYKFTQWNDGNTANPRNVTISADQNFTAIFEKLSTAISEVENATTVTIVNNKILVNGEAPAFVVTVSGQKIANANLKAGVYFVVVDGNSVKVVVR